MKVKEINWVGVGARFLLAMVLVFATYNPSGYSYFHWGIKHISDFSVLKLFAGVVLLIGWTMFIRATLVSLGAFGIVLGTGPSRYSRSSDLSYSDCGQRSYGDRHDLVAYSSPYKWSD